MKTTRFTAFAGLILGAQLAAAQQASVPLDIKAQPMETALQEFSSQTGLQVMFPTELTAALTAPGLRGRYVPIAALEELLARTGLTYQFINERTVAITDSTVPRPGAPRAMNSTDGGDIQVAQAATSADSSEEGRADNQNPLPSAAGKDDRVIDEVIVTAQKRSERLQDVPVPVTAIGGDVLQKSNLLRLQDYYTRIPGLSLTVADGQGQGAPQLTIRGLTTGGGLLNPTVSITVDDVQYGPSTGATGRGTAPDIDPSELAQVEVLRGPQGTLYGSSSIGGLLKFVTVEPSTDGVSGRVQVGINSVYNGDELGYSMRGAINVPLSDTVAVRASGFTRRDPGYIDDPAQGTEGVNRADVSGGRVSALWKPTQDFSLKLGALLQDNKVHGTSRVYLLPGLGDLQQSALRGTGWYSNNVEAYSAILNAKIKGADLTAVSGYNINAWSDSIDSTPFFGPLTQEQFGVTGTPYIDYFKTEKFTQEIRLSMPVGRRFEWLFGAYYNHEDTPQVTDILAADPATGAPVDAWLHFTARFKYAEYAAFTNLTFNMTDRFDIQVGGRQSQNKQTQTSTYIGEAFTNVFLGSSSPTVTPVIDSKDTSFTYLITPRFKVSPDLMVYGRLASGYRPGGPNGNIGGGIPPTFGPDTTLNYEVGVKGNTPGHILSFDASLYYIEWEDIQLTLLDLAAGASYVANAGQAKSQGIELSVQSRPLTGLAIDAWIAWNDAVLAEGFPATSTAYGASGDRLPYSSRFSGNISLDQEFPITSTTTGSVGASFSYVGDRVSIFTGSPQQLRDGFPAYSKIDLHAGATYQSWTADLFVTNLADKRGVLGGGQSGYPPPAFSYIQPRTVGLSFSRVF